MNQTTLVIYLGLLTSCCSTDKNTERSSLTAESDWLDENRSAVTSTETLQCPSPNIVHVKYKCPGPSNTWTDCTKSHCCPGFNLIDGRCISKDVAPCELNLCEQRCSFMLRRIICTCWDGYRFNPELQKRGEKRTCTDIDECAEGLHDCEQICTNNLGSYSCQCKDGFALRVDNKTCEKFQLLQERDHLNAKNANDEERRCLPSCDTVLRLQQKISRLQEKLTALETAVTLSMYHSSGQPDGAPAGPLTPRKGDEFHTASAAYSDDLGTKPYSILDSFIQTGAGYCKCQRGPIGPSGPPGITGQKGSTGDRGPRGPKGAAGNFDFLLLLLADMRHDIILLQERVFPGETLPKFDFEKVLKKQRSVEDHKTQENDGKSGVEDFEGSKTIRFSDYIAPEEGLVESSGDQWDQYEE